MGTAPTHGQENKGLDDKQINLGVVQPGERPAIFGDALRRLTNQAKFMHSDLGRYWYSMSASLNRIAADRAGQFEDALVALEIDKALNTYIGSIADRGHFDAVQVAPGSSADVPDEPGGVRAVVLGVAHPHSGRETSEALTEAKEILMQRGNTPRVYRNMIVFLAAELKQLDNLKSAQRSVLAWAEIVKQTDRLNLTQSDSAMAKSKLTQNVYDTVRGQHLLIPQGSRLIGRYQSEISFGQDRALVVWDRILMPDGSSITISEPGSDASGYAGLKDRTDHHWDKVFAAAGLATLLGIGAELGPSEDGDIERAIRRGTTDTINEAGQRAVDRSLGVQPSITVRPGWPVRVIVTRDLVLRPYEEPPP